MKIAIIGAGFTGLSLGYYLSKNGHKITIFDKNNFIGGLASGFKAGDYYLERFYHHIFDTDKDIIQLTTDLGLKNIWRWKDCGAPIFYDGKIYPFSTAKDLITFSPLKIHDRIRTGVVSLFLKSISNYHYFENIRSIDWIQEWMGKSSFEILWQPLIEKKFGEYNKDIAMTWVWARIHKRSRFLGYPKGGFQTIINALVNKIKQRKSNIILNKEIIDIRELNSYDKIIFTGSPGQLLKIAPNISKKYKNKLQKIEYCGVVVALLFLSKPLHNWAYWININDLGIPFVGCVIQTNLVNQNCYNNLFPAYLTAYTTQNSKLFNNNKETILKEWSIHLKKINGNFNNSWIKKSYLFKEALAQPVFKVNTYKHIPDFRTSIDNTYFVSMSQIYPWDRGLNYSVSITKKFIKYFEKI